MRRWIKRAAWTAVVMFLGFMAIGIANLPPRTPMPRIAEAPPPDPLLTGTHAKVIRATLGCSRQSDYEALADIAVAMGDLAYMESAQQHVMTGKCRTFNVGQDVQIAGVAVIAELRAIRAKGETGTYWITERALQAELD